MTYPKLINSLLAWICLILVAFSYTQIAHANTNCGNNCNTAINVSVRIYNSFSGTLDRWYAQSQYIQSGLIYTNNPNIFLSIGANSSSDYTLSWSLFTGLYGSGIGIYSGLHETTLSTGDGIKYISIFYNKSGEYYNPNTLLTVFLDTSPPSLPEYSTMNGFILNGSTFIGFSGSSVDTGVGFSGYRIHFSMDPLFWSDDYIIWDNSGLLLRTDDFPYGTIYRYIESIDYLGNSISGSIQYFHNGLPSIPSNGWSSYIPQELQKYYNKNPEVVPITTQIQTIISKKTIKKMIKENFELSDSFLQWILPQTLPDTGVCYDSQFIHSINSKINRKLWYTRKHTVSLLWIILWIILFIGISLWISLFFKKDLRNSWQ